MAINFSPGTLSRNIPGFDPTAAWTVAWWVRPHTDTPPTGQYRQYYTHGGLAGTNWIWTGSYESSFGGNSVGFETGDNDEFYDSTIVSLPLGVWAHLAVTYNPTTHDVLLYKDHTLVGSLNLDLAGLDDTWDGHDEWFAGQWGNMEGAYLRLWQDTLNATEITAESLAPRAVRTANLLADTPLDSTSDVGDYSGHGNHWTLTGAYNTVPGPTLPTQITRVQGTGKRQGANQTVLVLPVSTAPVIGNSLVILLSNYKSNPNFPVWTCVDNYGNTYRHAGGTSTGSIGASVWYCPKISATGPGFAVTLTANGACYWTGSVIELHTPAGLAVDQIATLIGSGSPNVTLPPLAGPDAVLAAVCCSGANQASITVSAASPAWTEEHEELSFNVYVPGEGDTRLLGPAIGTTPSVSWTVPTNTSVAAVLVAFKPDSTVDTQRTEAVAVTDRVFAGFLPPVVVKADAVTVSESATAQRGRVATVLTQPNWVSGVLFAGTGFCTPMGWANLQLVSEANCPFRMDQGGTIRRLAVLQNVAPGAGASRTFTFRKNGVNQALTVTLGATETYKADETHSFTVAAGDLVVIGVTVTGSPATGQFALVWDFEPTNNVAHYAIGGNVQDVQNNGPHWLSPFSGGSWATGAVQGDTLVGVAGTITQYRMTLSNAPGAGRLRTIVWVKNGVMQDGTGGTPDTTLIIAGTAKDGATTCTLIVAEGDRVSVRMIGTGSPTSTYFTGSHSFMPFAPYEIPLAGACSVNSAQSNATSYTFGIGDCTFSTVELQMALPAPLTDLTLRRMRLMVEVALVSGAHVHDYTLRRNLAATPQTLTIGPLVTTVGPAAGADVIYHFGDVLTVQAVTGGTLSNVRPHWAFAAQSLIAGSLSVLVKDTIAVSETATCVIRPQKLLVPIRIEGISVASELEVAQQSAHLLTANVRDTVRAGDDIAIPGRAFGFTRVQVTPRVQVFSNAISVTFAKPPSVGNAIVLMVGGYGEAVADAGTASDNRGNPYAPGPVAAASNTASGNFARIFYAPAIRATGTPFTVTATFGTSNPRWAIAVEVQSGGWGLVLDRSVADIPVVGPPLPVTTGATLLPLTATDEFLAALYSVGGVTYTYSVVESATPIWRQETESFNSSYAGEANTRIVTEALGTTPSCTWYHSYTSWAAAALAAFKTGSALGMVTGTTISVRLAETLTARDAPAPLRRPVPILLVVAESITTRESRELPLPPSSTPQMLTPQGIRINDPLFGSGVPRTDIDYEGPWPSGPFTIGFWAQGWGYWELDQSVGGDYIQIQGVDNPFGLMLECWSGGRHLDMPTDEQWHYVTIISQAIGVTVAVDRSQVTISLPTPPPYDWEGFSGSGGYQPSGLMSIAYYRIWDAVLTPAELRLERAARRAVRTANLWRDTPLEGGSLLDVSGNARPWAAFTAPDVLYGEPLPWVADVVGASDVAAATVLAANDRFAVELVRTTDVLRAVSPISRTLQEVSGVRDALAVAPFDPRTAKQVRWYTTRLVPSYYPSVKRAHWDVAGTPTPGGYGQFTQLLYTPLPPYEQSWVYAPFLVSGQTGAAGSTGYCMTTITEPLPAQVITGFVNLCHYIVAPSPDYLAGYRLYIYVTIGETDGVRGVLLDYTSPTEWNHWPSMSRWWQLEGDALLSPVGLQTGDRVVIEWGFVAHRAYASSSNGIGYYATTQYGRNDGVPKRVGSPVTSIGIGGEDAPLTYGYNGYIDFKSGIFVNPIVARPAEIVGVSALTFRSGPGPLKRLVFDARTVSDLAVGNRAFPTLHPVGDPLTVAESVATFLQATYSVKVHEIITVTSVATCVVEGGPPPVIVTPSLPIGVFERVHVIEDRLRSVETSKLVVRAYEYVTTIDAKTLALYGTAWDGGGTPPAPTPSVTDDYWLVGI